MRLSLQNTIVMALFASRMVAAEPALGEPTSIPGQGTWETTLQARDLDGDGDTDGFYDTVLDITWLGGGNWLGGPYSQSVGVLVANQNHFGFTGWRLPRVAPVDGTTLDDDLFSTDGVEDRGYNISAPYPVLFSGNGFPGSTASELAHLFYNTLGNSALQAVPGAVIEGIHLVWGLANIGPFFDIPEAASWTETPYAPEPSNAWLFDFADGLQEADHLYGTAVAAYVWPVHDGDIGFVPTAAPQRAVNSPVRLHAARPNPFNPSTTIAYSTSWAGHVELTIYDMAGRVVRSLVSESLDAGEHSVIWDGKDESGQRVASGVYLYRLEAGEFEQTRRMVLLK